MSQYHKHMWYTYITVYTSIYVAMQCTAYHHHGTFYSDHYKRKHHITYCM